MDRVKWGIIGCGDVTEIKSGPAFQKVPNSELVAVMRRNSSLAADFAARHKVPKWFDSAGELINCSEVNAVYIATPPESHCKYAIQTLKAKKPVYVEKPMALNYGECMKMVEASEKYSTPLYVAYYRRALPGFLKVKSLIENGEIGKVRLVNIQLFKSFSQEEIEGITTWRVIPQISGGGNFVDLASHQIDYLQYLFGEVSELKSLVKNQGNKYKAEDIVSASFIAGGEVLINGLWCFTVDKACQKDRLEIVGDKGRIQFSTFDFMPIVLENHTGIETFENTRPNYVQYYLIEQVVQNLLGKGTVVSTGRTAAETNRVMDIILKDYYNNFNTKI